MRSKIRALLAKIRQGHFREIGRQIQWIYHYARRYWFYMVIYILTGLTGTAVSLLSSLASKDLVDIITGHETGVVVETFCIMIGLNVGNLILNQFSSYVSTYLNMKVDSEIKADIFSRILETDWESLTQYHTGDLLTRWGSDASVIANGVLSFIPDAIIYFVRFISAFAMVLYYDASFAVFAFLGMPVSLLLSRVLLRRMVQNNEKSAAMSAKMSGFNQETFSNIQIIKAFDLLRLYAAKLQGLQKDYIDMRMGFQRMSAGTSLLISSVTMLTSYASYGWGIYRVWSGGISYGTMTMFLGLSGTLTGTLNNLTSLVPTAISLTTAAGRLMDILDMPREDFSARDQANAFRDAHRDSGISLKIRNLNYSYQDGVQVFRHASMEAHPHEIIALVGPSGEGKTTLIRLILALVQGQQGEAFLYSGQDRIEISPATRKLFSYVPQGNTMFSGTIAENMRNVKSDATDDEIEKALRMACAWDFIAKLPNGINSEIRERRGGFSEGQAQRLSIARALLRRSPLLLLDEATSALDVITEHKVLDNIRNDTYPRTGIITTHRPSALSICTRVYEIREKQCSALSTDEIQKLMDDFSSL